MTTVIDLTQRHQVKLVNEYWDEVEPINQYVTAEIIYHWVGLKYNCFVTHYGALHKTATFFEDKALTFFILKHGP